LIAYAAVFAGARSDSFGNPGLISHPSTAPGLGLIQRDRTVAVEHLQHALDLAIAVDVEYSPSQTRCHLAKSLGRLGRHRDALDMLAPNIQRHVRGALGRVRMVDDSGEHRFAHRA
jgi:hypothetical protein